MNSPDGENDYFQNPWMNAWVAETVAIHPLLRLAVLEVRHYAAEPSVVPLLHINAACTGSRIVRDSGLVAFVGLARRAILDGRPLIVDFPGKVRATVVANHIDVGLHIVIAGLSRPRGTDEDDSSRLLDVMKSALLRLLGEKTDGGSGFFDWSVKAY